MAGKNQVRKRAPSKKSQTAAKRGKRRQDVTILDAAIVREVVVILIIAISFVMILGVFTDSTGAFGNAVRGLLLGLFGIGAYLLPFAIIIYSVYVLLKSKPFFTYKTVVLMLLLVFIFSFAHVTGNGESIHTFADGAWNNGGIIGALLGNFLVKLIGTVGTYIFIVAMFLISFILLTGKSFIKVVSRIASIDFRLREHYDDDDDYDDDDEYDNEYDESLIVEPKSVAAPKKAVVKRAAQPIAKPIAAEPAKNEIQLMDFSRPSQPPVQPVPNNIPELKIIHGENQSSDDDIEILPPINENTDNADSIEIASADEQEEQKIKIIVPPPKKKEHVSSIPKGPVFLGDYEFPSLDMLQKIEAQQSRESKEHMLKNAKKLEETLASFGVVAKVVQINKGPTVTRYELTPRAGIKVSKIVGLSDDIALSLAASGIRIEAPIPGKSAVGIEIPNKDSHPVYLREVLEDEAFQKFPSKLAFGLGKDIAGQCVVTDIAKMPHLLIAGATGSGKSVCINTLITSILFKSSPEEVKLLMIDPKVVELSIYNGIPHLLIPVVTDPKKAAGALNWAVQEMINRYKAFAEFNVRDMKGYNALVEEKNEGEKFPHIVIIIDELADLMMAAPSDVEDSICRLAQMARAAGLHLIIATQRPSVDVITGIIKANIPSRLAFAVSSGTDSRTVLDTVGAEKLLGKGDMLFSPVGMAKPMRIQGAFISDKEVEQLVTFLKEQAPIQYDDEDVKSITSSGKKASFEDDGDSDSDEFLDEAIKFIVDKEKASVSMLQRQFRIGYNRAARLMEEIESRGIVGKEDGSKPRKVLITKSEYYSSIGEI